MGTKTQKLSNVVDQIVEWQSVFTGDGSTGLTAVAGRGYFIDTTSGTVTVTLPASPKTGDIIQLKDYARTWATNNVTTSSALFDGDTLSNTFSTEGQTVTLVYMDGTKGWSLINEDTTTGLGARFISATGGTITTDGDYKVHSFTGDGCFVVSCGGNAGGSNTVDYLVVAGGAGGGSVSGGGGGAGGVRYGSSGCGLPVSVTTYPITVGGGGNGVPCRNAGRGCNGSPSSFSTITSTGGGGGGSGGTSCVNRDVGINGGSGGGGSYSNPPLANGAGGTGNTPPVSPPQGNNGASGDITFPIGGGGGGGGTTAGSCSSQGGPGGTGFDATPIFGASPKTFYGPTNGVYGGGGGGGAGAGGPAPTGGTGGSGGGGNGAGSVSPINASNGVANTGGGAGGGGYNGTDGDGGTGGKGIVLIRYKFQ